MLRSAVRNPNIVRTVISDHSIFAKVSGTSSLRSFLHLKSLETVAVESTNQAIHLSISTVTHNANNCCLAAQDQQSANTLPATVTVNHNSLIRAAAGALNANECARWSITLVDRGCICICCGACAS